MRRPRAGLCSCIAAVALAAAVPVGEIYDYKQFSTMSGVCLIGIEADPTKFEVLR